MLVRLFLLGAAVLLLATRVAASDIVDLAADLVGRPYVWGAEGPRSFDCSGLTHYVFGEFGITLPRRAIDQSRVGVRVGRGWRRGDLLFFASDTRRSLVTHVGVYEGSGVMINASQRHGRVRRDDLDEKYWTERFMFARRITDDIDADRREERPSPRGAGEPRRRTHNDLKRETARALGRLADALLRRQTQR